MTEPNDLKGELDKVLALSEADRNFNTHRKFLNAAADLIRTHGARLKRALEDAEKWQECVDTIAKGGAVSFNRARASEQAP